MRQITKIRGLRDILAGALLIASITMPAPTNAQSPITDDQWVVVIDPGHGGKDPGAVGAKSREKNINLAVALKTGRYISENLKDVKVIYTRDDDTFIGLAERAEVANRHKADLFISIHSNAMTDQRFSGAETYVLGQTMDEANLQVAMKENSVITFEQDYQTKYEGFDPNSVESYIIFSLMQNTYLKQSTEFATLIQDQFRSRVGRKDRGVRQAGFQVLWRTTMPSVLVELGFVTNPEEEKFLISEQGQDYLASAIFRAFRDYKQAIDNRSGLKNGNGVIARSDRPAGTVTDGKPDSSGTVTAGKPDSAGTVTDGKPDSSGTVTAGKPDSSVTETPGTTTAEPARSRPQVRTDTRDEKTPPAIPAASSADGIWFMVQIAAMPAGRELNKSHLTGIETVTKIEDGERIKYAAGKYVLYDDALKYRRTLTGRFPDAFVIAVRNGRIVPLREAIESRKR
ncbi:MAG: N-acetylmuramoyl-L-alanine amidase family protein [Actinomycetota bacterium]